MAVPAALSLRPAIEADRGRLANLLHFETYVHRHLDWRRPLDWLGQTPYLIAETSGQLGAALACPPDLPGLSWVRLFATATHLRPQDAWELLWPEARKALRGMAVHTLAALPLHDWFQRLLTGSGFYNDHDVVVLDWRPDPGATPAAAYPALRPMTEDDLPAVGAVDQAAFSPLWQNSLEAVELAFSQAGLAAVIEEDGRIVAYQISTHSARGPHLARLATHPDYQGRGYAQALVRDVQAHVIQRDEGLLTVNTQDNNAPSLALYKKMGFKFTGEQFPVYQYDLSRDGGAD
ncbi:MAG: GNAT family N-acetyltransferase [Anaerolineales bacterium]|nr:GNAT family N-acetyltransferase [Anaerolineales bacterium]